ncbi:hypothetical protein GCM10007242_00610 [Pigmentiphaga litoralis]|nr:hypothetical protein GCM10007242_00610 [Pigmentiphaga litoralis]
MLADLAVFFLATTLALLEAGVAVALALDFFAVAWEDDVAAVETAGKPTAILDAQSNAIAKARFKLRAMCPPVTILSRRRSLSDFERELSMK